jgi:hypothetical protein
LRRHRSESRRSSLDSPRSAWIRPSLPPGVDFASARRHQSKVTFCIPPTITCFFMTSPPQSSAAVGLAPRPSAPTQVRGERRLDYEVALRPTTLVKDLQAARGGGGRPALWGGVGGRRTPSLLGPSRASPRRWWRDRGNALLLAVLFRRATRAHSPLLNCDSLFLKRVGCSTSNTVIIAILFLHPMAKLPARTKLVLLYLNYSSD